MAVRRGHGRGSRARRSGSPAPSSVCCASWRRPRDGCSPARCSSSRCWGYDYVGDTKLVDVHMYRLRIEDRGGSGQTHASCSPCAASATRSSPRSSTSLDRHPTASPRFPGATTLSGLPGTPNGATSRRRLPHDPTTPDATSPLQRGDVRAPGVIRPAIGASTGLHGGDPETAPSHGGFRARSPLSPGMSTWP